MATSIGSNPQGPGTLYGTTRMPKQTDPQSGAAGATAGAGAPVLQTLSDDQLRELAADLAAANAGLTAALGDYGSTPISLPEVTVTTDMGALSTADLLQLIRAESRKTTELLLIATSESIKNQQAQIDLDSQSSIAQLKDAAASQEKAEKMAKTMNIVKWVAFGVGVAALAAMAVAAVVTGGAALIAMVAISALLMATMTVLSEVKCADGRSPMDHGMEWLTDVMAKLGEAMDKLPPWLLPLVPGGALFAIPDSVISDELKAQIMAQLLMITVMIVISVAAVGAAGSMVASAAQTSATVASEAATTAATMASETSAQAAANAAARVASEMGIAATKVSKYLELLQGGLNLANSGVGIAEAKFEFDASMANARVQELKEMVKMLQTLLDGDAEFISMLAEIQAQLDSGCAEIVATEHQTQENIGREMFS